MSWPHLAPRPRPEEPDHPFRYATTYLGLIIDVETDAGEARTGVSEDGTPWSHVLPYAYGEVRGTKAMDGDPIDVFLGPDRLAPFVYVIQSKFPGAKRIDETKSMLGFLSQEDAVAAFRACYGQPGFFLNVKRWPAAAWVEAMGRPEVHGGKMERPLSKGAIGFVLSLATLAKAHDEKRLIGAHVRSGHAVAPHLRTVHLEDEPPETMPPEHLLIGPGSMHRHEPEADPHPWGPSPDEVLRPINPPAPRPTPTPTVPKLTLTDNVRNGWAHDLRRAGPDPDGTGAALRTALEAGGDLPLTPEVAKHLSRPDGPLYGQIAHLQGMVKTMRPGRERREVEQHLTELQAIAQHIPKGEIEASKHSWTPGERIDHRAKITTRKVEKLAHREDGQVVEYGEPVPCHVCGKKCTAKVHHMSDGTQVGQECAGIVERVSEHAAHSGAPVSEDFARFHGANDKQIKHLRARGLIHPGDPAPLRKAIGGYVLIVDWQELLKARKASRKELEAAGQMGLFGAPRPNPAPAPTPEPAPAPVAAAPAPEPEPAPAPTPEPEPEPAPAPQTQRAGLVVSAAAADERSHEAAARRLQEERDAEGGVSGVTQAYDGLIDAHRKAANEHRNIAALQRYKAPPELLANARRRIEAAEQTLGEHRDALHSKLGTSPTSPAPELPPAEPGPPPVSDSHHFEGGHLYHQTSLGNIERMEVRSAKFEVKPYAQYDRALHVTIVPKGKRSPRTFVLGPRDHNFAAFVPPGSAAPEMSDPWEERPGTSGVKIKTTKYHPGDPRWVAEATGKLPADALIWKGGDFATSAQHEARAPLAEDKPAPAPEPQDDRPALAEQTPQQDDQTRQLGMIHPSKDVRAFWEELHAEPYEADKGDPRMAGKHEDPDREAFIAAMRDESGSIKVTPQIARHLRSEIGPIHGLLDIAEQRVQSAEDMGERSTAEDIRRDLREFGRMFPEQPTATINAQREAIYGKRTAAEPAAEPEPAPEGPKAAPAPVQLHPEELDRKAHVRMTSHGPVVVGPSRQTYHVADETGATISGKEAFKMRAPDLHAHVAKGGPNAKVAQAELDRRAARAETKGKRGGRRGSQDPAPAPTEPDAPVTVSPAEPGREYKIPPRPARESKKTSVEKADGKTWAAGHIDKIGQPLPEPEAKRLADWARSKGEALKEKWSGEADRYGNENTARRANMGAQRRKEARRHVAWGERLIKLAERIEDGSYVPTTFDAMAAREKVKDVMYAHNALHPPEGDDGYRRGPDPEAAARYGRPATLTHLPEPERSTREPEKVAAWNEAVQRALSEIRPHLVQVSDLGDAIPHTPTAVAAAERAAKILSEAYKSKPPGVYTTPRLVEDAKEARNNLEAGLVTEDAWKTAVDRLSRFREATDPGAKVHAGKWSPPDRSANDTSEGRHAKAAELEAKRWKDPEHKQIPGYFPTPYTVGARAIDNLDVDGPEPLSILEPSAGTGELADLLPARHKLTTAEHNQTLQKVLQQKGYDPKPDALKVDGQYDRVLMNPPFENSQDIDHVIHAFTHNLKPGGKLVAIVSGGALTNSREKNERFRQFVAAHRAEDDQHIDPSAWKRSGTAVAATMITLQKPG